MKGVAVKAVQPHTVYCIVLYPKYEFFHYCVFFLIMMHNRILSLSHYLTHNKTTVLLKRLDKCIICLSFFDCKEEIRDFEQTTSYI